jgi:hypothetical protein
LPADAATVADYYKQNVYDPADEKIGQIADFLLEKSGTVPAAMISVGGFLDTGVFSALEPSMSQLHSRRCRFCRKNKKRTSVWTQTGER